MIVVVGDFGIFYKTSNGPVLFDKCIGKSMVVCTLCDADRQPWYSSNYKLLMALWFVSYTTSIIVIVYDVSISKAF